MKRQVKQQKRPKRSKEEQVFMLLIKKGDGIEITYISPTGPDTAIVYGVTP